MKQTFAQTSKIAVVLLSSVVLLSGCGRQISSNVYKAGAVGETSFTYQGVIVNARHVQVSEGEKLSDNTAGIGMGALAGGLLGTQIGGGTGQIAATAGGAILGGIAGAYAEKALSDQTGMEYTVQLTNGQMLTVVQGPDPIYQAGQRVMVISSNDGRSRIVPDNSPMQHIQAPMAQPAVQYNKREK